MSEQKHFLALVIEDGTPEVRFVCMAKRGDECHKRPSEERESWKPDDPDLIDTDACWIADWIEATSINPDDGGPRWEDEGEILRLPIICDYYDEGMSPVCEVQTQAAHDAEVAAAALDEAAEKLFIPSEGPAYYVDVALAERKASEYLRSLAAQKRGA